MSRLAFYKAFRILLGLIVAFTVLYCFELVARKFAPKPSLENGKVALFVWDHRGNPQLYRHDPDLFWKPRVNEKTEFNRFDLRGNEPDRPKKRFRILCLGDSITFGFALPYKESFPAKLNALFSSEAEVLNAGVCGYTIVQGRRFFERDLRNLSADLVLAQFGVNDYQNAYKSDSIQPRIPSRLYNLHQSVSRLGLYNLLAAKIRPPVPKANTVRVKMEEFVEQSRLLAESVEKRKGKVVFLKAVILENDGSFFDPPYPFFDGAHVIDMKTPFEQFPLEQRKNLFIDSVHPNDQGTTILAQYLAEQLQPWIKTGPTSVKQETP